MCIICRREYNNDTTEINCNSCQNVTKIPLLPNLTHLYCSITNITEIPLLPNLNVLDCWNTNITEIPPNLKELYCENCKWLQKSYKNKEEFNKRINKLMIIQRLWKWKKIQPNILLINDLKEYCVKPYFIN